MLRTRVMPCLLLEGDSLVKTVKFKRPCYIGDPINAVRIYNELEVDELIFLDILSSKDKKAINFEYLEEIAKECFMPFSYGGGVSTFKDAERLFKLGVEKVCINSAIYTNPNLVKEIVTAYGTQSVIAGIDVKKNFFGRYKVRSVSGTNNTGISPVEHAKYCQELGVGEILLNNIDKDGVMDGFDLDLITSVSKSVSIPVVSLGGAGELNDVLLAKNAGSSAIGLGSMAVYQNKNKGILINFPDSESICSLLGES